MIRVGVIGVGAMGRNHCRAYSELAGVELAGVCDANHSTATAVAKEFGCGAYASVDELLSQRLDAVSVAVPTSLHEKVVLQAISAGVPTLVEKPIAFDEAEARRMVKVSCDKRVLLAVGHIERFNPAVTAAKRLLDEGTMGKLYSLVFRRIGTLPSRVKDINVIQDIGVHDIDLAKFFTGRAPRAFSVTAGCAVIANRYDYAQALFDLGSGLSAFIECNWITPTKLRQFSIVGEKGLLVGDLANQKLDYYPTIVDRSGGSPKIGQVERKEITVEKAEPLKLELQHFVNCVEGRDEPRVPLEDAVQAIATANELTNSLMKRYAFKKALRNLRVPDALTNRLIGQR